MKKNIALALILCAFIPLALLYAYATPIFEAPDEYYHFAMVNKVASDWQLPVQHVDDGYTDWHQEGSQPPLYYLVSAVLVAPFDRSDYHDVRQLNPHAVVGRPDVVGNKNRVIHDAIYPPLLTGTSLTVYFVRLLSILLGAVTVFAVYQAGCVVAPQQPLIAFIGASLVAFNPQFLFMSASVNNDNLVTAFNSVILWQTLVMLRNGFNTRRSTVLSVLIALATISKLGGLVMVVVVASAGVWVGWRRKEWRGLVILGVSMVVAWLGLASWWYIRNITLYHELFGTQTMLNIFGRRDPPLAPFEILQSEGKGLRESFWGLFGWFSISAPSAFYTLMDAVTACGLVGLGIFAWRHRQQRAFWEHFSLLGLALTVGFGSFMAWTMQTYASQGRLLFPYIVAIALFLAMGLSVFLPQWLARVGVVGLGFVALAMPLTIIMPTYAPQAMVDALPTTATPMYARFGDIELLGYQVENKRYAPTDAVTLTLFWHPLVQSREDLSAFVHLVKPSDQIINTVTSFPNYGSRRTTTWQAKRIYSDTYTLEVPGYEGGAYLLEAWVGWWTFPENKGVDPLDENGQPMGVVRIPVGGFATLQPKAPPMPNTITGDFGGIIRLTGYDWQADGHLTLAWQSLAPTPEDYTVFVFLSDATGTLVAQGDAPPALPTHYWHVGDGFISEHTLTVTGLPRGRYTLEVGWYRPTDFTRLTTTGIDNRFTVGQINIP